ncbi:Enoyl-[acyl-carrier-protein] reductase [NADH] FabI [Candidatus Arsenophonus lipoptenae]|uniref:Enoyl-[acyl-carrier-protein] reductase [NADH] n=1 Tax=Candidatus Arsenophonus lipoptenae TaxID=634113 RepID=A0A0X9VTE2_9GAMM|nr:SDR family oxidoreductase [Candidatus Arsenophonus lipoptenae]AMA65087.1 Enoyl-[acyl-carrier-protein] reductase [NADH] FabI [Candidatus Arsenophonus lipoptenae]
MGFMIGKRILITGLASKLSIAYGIAKAMHKQGAELAFSYQGNKLKYRVKEIAKKFGSKIVLPCDVTSDENISILFKDLSKIWKNFDGFIHSIAYAPATQLNGDYVNTVTRQGFQIAHDISSFSLVALAKACRNMLNPNSSIVTLTYLGSERAIPNYNIMGLAKASLEANVRYMANSMGPQGIRVNGISAGPIRTLAASGIKNFRNMLEYYKLVTPIKYTVTTENIGNWAAFLCSDLSTGVTGEIIHVDSGFNIIGITGTKSRT